MLDPRLGTREQFEALAGAARAAGMGVVLDIVPNHMAAHVANPWWRDVLAHGEHSRWASHFDIDWAANSGRLVLPVLGAPLAEVLAAGELSMTEDGELAYFERRLPLAPDTARLGSIAQVVGAQHYELAHWRDQSTRLNYRRFFDITDLVGVRVERDEVFDDVHALVLELVAAGHVTGIRVDHVDGLLDPRGYLERLQHALRDARGGDPAEPFWVVVEKILAPGEALPATWPVAGTTGYEFLDACDGLFVDPDGADAVIEHYAQVAEQPLGFEQVVAHAKLRIIREYFWGELGRLARAVAATDGEPCDEAEERRLRDALAVVTAQLPVYRTYVEAGVRSPEDAQRIELALAGAAGVEGVDALALARVARALREDDALAMRWQQFSGPVTAKSVEDTAFYRWHAVPARNEVGAHPAHPAGATGSFHWLCAARAEHWPGSLNASSTHDTKRSEDVRARMLALTEAPLSWCRIVDRWLDELDAPDRNDGWMVASALVGAWPIDAARLEAYVTKAVREEKLRTSWTDPDEAYEARIVAFAERLRTSGDIEGIVERVRERGERNSLASTALRLFAPGVPDLYQGSEVELLALVDPDNRRPVDFASLDVLLDSDAAPAKLRLVAAMLRARRDHPAPFTHGTYVPLRSDAPGVLAFARQAGDAWALVVVPRPGFVAQSRAMLELPAGAPTRWRSVVTGTLHEPGTTPIARMLDEFPVLAALGV